MSLLKTSAEVTPKHLAWMGAVAALLLGIVLFPGRSDLGPLGAHVSGDVAVMYRSYAGSLWRVDSAPAAKLTVEQADALLAPLQQQGWARKRENRQRLGSKMASAMIGGFDDRVQFTSPNGVRILRATVPPGGGVTLVSSARKVGLRERVRISVLTNLGLARVFEGRP